LLPRGKFSAPQEQGICCKSLEILRQLMPEASNPRRFSKNSLLNSLPQGIRGSGPIMAPQGGRDVAERYDLAIIGDGINGRGVARDAAGCGLAVHPCEMDRSILP